MMSMLDVSVSSKESAFTWVKIQITSCRNMWYISWPILLSFFLVLFFSFDNRGRRVICWWTENAWFRTLSSLPRFPLLIIFNFLQRAELALGLPMQPQSEVWSWNLAYVIQLMKLFLFVFFQLKVLCLFACVLWTCAFNSLHVSCVLYPVLFSSLCLFCVGHG